jgi:hypothetical protein
MPSKPARELEQAQTLLEIAATNHRAALLEATNAANHTAETRDQHDKRRAVLTLAGLEGKNADERLANLSQQLEPEANQLKAAELLERRARAELTNAENALMVARYRVRVWLALTESSKA